MIQDEEIRCQIRLGEDSHWEFRQIEFRGDRPTSPRRKDLADELGAFANADGGIVLCGVADNGTLQGMSREQMAALNHLLVEVSTDALEPPLRIVIHHKELDGKAFVLVSVPRGKTLHEQTVPGTGFETLNERLWEPLLSVAGAADPRRGLANLCLLAQTGLP